MLNLIAVIKSLTSDTHEKLGKLLLERGLQIASAESCTGGLLSSRLTDVGGSSAYVKANFVTYSNASKTELLGVSPRTLEKYGAVSEECAREMAEGLMDKTGCDIAVCTTGIAGPAGGTAEKPAGLVYIAVGFNKFQPSAFNSSSPTAPTVCVKSFTLSPRYNRKSMKFLFTEKALETVIGTLINRM